MWGNENQCSFKKQQKPDVVPTLQHTHVYWPWPYLKVTTTAILLWLYLSSMGSSSTLLSELKAVWTGRWTRVFVLHPPIFSSLINCMVSVDVKHHWTNECTFILWILVLMILVLFQDYRGVGMVAMKIYLCKFLFDKVF